MPTGSSFSHVTPMQQLHQSSYMTLHVQNVWCARVNSLINSIPHPFHSITGSDEDAIMSVLGSRSNKQRQEIAAKFEQEYSKVS